jgi:hypothetical protein
MLCIENKSVRLVDVRTYILHTLNLINIMLFAKIISSLHTIHIVLIIIKILFQQHTTLMHMCRHIVFHFLIHLGIKLKFCKSTSSFFLIFLLMNEFYALYLYAL